MVNNGQKVSVHYVGTFSDGTVFDQSRDKSPLAFTVGSGEVIPGFDNAVREMMVGETRTVNIPCTEAYGNRQENSTGMIPRTEFPKDFLFEAGRTVQGNGPQGVWQAVIVSWDENNVTLDANHPLAGKDLNFEIELLGVQ